MFDKQRQIDNLREDLDEMGRRFNLLLDHLKLVEDTIPRVPEKKIIRKKTKKDYTVRGNKVFTDLSSYYVPAISNILRYA